jgi:PAS domain S-box-containing protein
MQYKEIMQPLTSNDFISTHASIDEALKRIKKSELSVLIVKNEKGEISGILTKDKLLDAYSLNVELDSKVEMLIQKNYRIIEENTEVKKGIFLDISVILVADRKERIVGILTENIFAEQILRFIGEEIKTDPYSSKTLTSKEDSERESLPHEYDYFMDCYKKIKKVINTNHKLWDIITFSSDSIYVTDGNGTTLYANEAFEKMIGVSTQKIIGKSVFDAEKEGIYRPSVSAIVLREKKSFTVLQKGLSGKELIVTGVPVFDANGNISMVVCNTKDVDELRVLKNYLGEIKPHIVRTDNDSSNRHTVIYKSKYMENLMSIVQKVAELDTTVMLTGESGVGKGLIARYIHENSSRAKEKLVEINCSAIPESLFEAELFGYESGAFTGAKKGGKIGLIEMANKGTLVLDEIGDMPMHMQVKLLKVLQDKKLTRIGSVKPIDVDVRIIAATNKDLKQLINKGLFREDLYYRLNVFPIHIASLRDRKDDIQLLLQHFLSHYNKKYGRDVVLTQEAQERLMNYSWPGNVRELEHFIERLVIISEGIVDIDGLEMERAQGLENEEQAVIVNRIIPLKDAVDETERQLIKLALKISKNSYVVADLLNISQASAYRRIRKYS